MSFPNESPDRWIPPESSPDRMFPVSREVEEEEQESVTCTYAAIMTTQEEVLRGENNVWVYGRELMENIASFKNFAMAKFEQMKMEGRCNASASFHEQTWNEVMLTPSQARFGLFTRTQMPVPPFELEEASSSDESEGEVPEQVPDEGSSQGSTYGWSQSMATQPRHSPSSQGSAPAVIKEGYVF